MRRTVHAVLFCFVLISLCLAFFGCENIPADDEKITVVATIFPEYDWVKQMMGDSADKIDIHLLLDSGVDMHSYQGTAKDMLTVTTCDLLICVGGSSDAWIEDALANAQNKDMQVVRLLDVLGDSAHFEEHAEGMQSGGHHHEEDKTDALDEHVWLSLKNAELFCHAIADKLALLLPKEADIIRQNERNYCDALNALDKDYRLAVQNTKHPTLLFADRFPFLYLAKDYAIPYYAAFSGCASLEAEATPATRIFLANKVDELGVTCLLQTESGNDRLPQAIKESAKTGNSLRVLTLDSMQSVTADRINEGLTYLSVMQKNLEVLKIAFE